MLADALGRPLRLLVTPGQASDVTGAPALLEGQEAEAVLADKAYDSNDLRDRIAAMKAQAVIPRNATASSSSRTTSRSTSTATGSRDASIASSTSAASPRATTAEPSTSQASRTSQQ